MPDRNDNDYLRRRPSRRAASEFHPAGGKFVVARQFNSASAEDGGYLLKRQTREGVCGPSILLREGTLSSRWTSYLPGRRLLLLFIPSCSRNNLQTPSVSFCFRFSSPHCRLVLRRAVRLVNEKSPPATELADDSPADDYKSV